MTVLSNNYSGVFIVLEGGEGAGKSTQAQKIAEYIHNKFHKITLLTREPGGSVGGEEIRRLLVNGSISRWDGVSELLLLMAARRDHIVKTILPALKEGEVVICDRFLDSSRAYQGAGHGVADDKIMDVYNVVAEGFAPDLTIVLDISVEEGLKRAEVRASKSNIENRYEMMGGDFHQRVRDKFLEIAKNSPRTHKVIDASGNAEEVFSNIAPVIDELFEGTSK